MGRHANEWQYTSQLKLVSKSNFQTEEVLMFLDGEDRFDMTFNPCSANFARSVFRINQLRI